MQATDKYIPKNENCIYIYIYIYTHTHTPGVLKVTLLNYIHVPGEDYFMKQCSGDMKYAMKMVDKNLNNLCMSSLSLSNSGWL
jgi:hypothetical protein